VLPYVAAVVAAEPVRQSIDRQNASGFAFTMNARRISALLEVLGVYITGQYVVALFVGTLHLQIENPLTHLNAQMTGAELLFAARDVLLLFLMQYAGWILLIVPINWWHRRSGPAAYGLTRAGKSWTVLLAAGVVAAALSAWPETSVELLDTIFHFGPTLPWRQALLDMSWRRWEFWLFTAVLSWAFVACMEEFFFRGYCQRRLAEDWGDGAAIFGTASLFVFSHSQYLIANSYNLSVLASLFVLAVGIGVVFAWTRSLVPAVVAHSIVNVPMTPFWQALVWAAFLVGTALFSRRGIAVVKQVFAEASALWCLVLASVCAVYAVASQGESAAVYVAAVMLGLAIGLEAMQRGREPGTRPVSNSFE
jgi:membrane protease YdiL (CAAX protease family)